MNNIRRYKDWVPKIGEGVWIDSSAVIIGDVLLEKEVSIWPQVVLRGDQGRITICEGTNIQDGSVAHATGGRSVVYIGKRCTVGHRVILHGCHVEDDCLIGMGSIILDNSHIGSGSIIGAGAVVTSGTIIPERSLVLGCPAKVVRILSLKEQESWITHGYQEYQKLRREVLDE